MPLSPPVPREHFHTRTVTCQGFHRQDGLWDIEGRIVDVKTYAFDNEWRGRVEAGTPVHEMWIRLTLDGRMTIVGVEAATEAAPFRPCAGVAAHFKRLEGLRVGPGFLREARARVGGTEGCTHIVEMLQQVATVAYQTIFTKRGQKASADAAAQSAAAKTDAPAAGAEPKRKPYVIDTCHTWRSDGETVKRFLPAWYTGADKPQA
jgi:hypothetical protein